ncbi:MAG: 16S rRNA (guanine(966)-N(2))-methyltransferase RsmD [Bacilli bacterium]|nr:16S rRNA (guanine(966)-N(2))-methyltransferase RsmD [Bacilli bacterium]
MKTTKIIAGIYRGKNISLIKRNNIRPTKNIVREAIFNIIPEKNIKNKIFLDLFAGCGTVGIEAASRMAKAIYFVDYDYEATKIIKKNLVNLNIKNAIVIKKNFLSSCRYFKEQKIKFDVIFVDPPYNFSKKQYLEIFGFFKQNNLLKNKFIFIFESSFILNFLELSDCLIKNYKYGKTFICVIKKI